jgi:hypothetical protein
MFIIAALPLVTRRLQPQIRHSQPEARNEVFSMTEFNFLEKSQGFQLGNFDCVLATRLRVY